MLLSRINASEDDNTTINRQRMTGYEEAVANARRCSSGMRRAEISQPE